jgi:uncharacterized protein YbgA (DUF1722 family)/uncharacterized protein YbbK (DUF523 family)
VPEFARPIIVMSKCLELEACRYNGQLVRAPIVLTLLPFVEPQAICPEVEIGLGIPRDPIRLVSIGGSQRLVQPSTGKDVTGDMRRFADSYLASLDDVDGFILKSRSPSCGIKDTKIYSGDAGDQPSERGPGMFGAAVLERFPRAAIEDEGRLTNFRLRHHFLTKLFANAALRTVRDSGRLSALVQFHAEQKLTLMAHHQQRTRELGRIVAAGARSPFGKVVDAYAAGFGAALAHPARSTSNINVLQHALGYFSDGLRGSEKGHFLAVLEEYRAGRVPLSVPLALLQSWIVRFDEPYLAQQRFFAPYPAALTDLRDSGHGT